MKEKLQRFIKAFQMNGQVKKRTILISAGVLAAIVVVILLICLLPKKETEEAPKPVASTTNVKPEKEELEVEYPKDMESIMKKYDDVYAWLEIPGTSKVLTSQKQDVSYPVAQHPTDRGYYLNHDLDGNYYQPGTLFTEASVEGKIANGLDMNDPVTIIYGHNQADCSMLGGIQAFVRQLDFSQKPLMYVYQDGRKITYQIVGGMQYDSTHIIYYHQFEKDEVFDDFFSLLWSGRYGDTHVDADNMPVHGDRVLILLTCDNDTSNDEYRYLVIGKMIEDTADPTVAEKNVK